ncbi:MAG TPA: hypothetical protein VGN60_08970 [Devosia sp.]|jgi:hypothetical protein|nr:hypothetical protein [Devosia sp.]
MTDPDLIDLNATVALAEAVIIDPRKKFTMSADSIMAMCHCLVALADEPGVAGTDCAIDGADERRCRVCGCTQNNACWADPVGACWWAEPDLCSHCQPTTNARLAAAIASFIKAHEHDQELRANWAEESGLNKLEARIAQEQAFTTLKSIFETEFPQ